MFPSSKFDQDVIGFWNMNWRRFNFLIYWAKVNEQSDVILCKCLLWFILGSLLSLDETGADRLNFYVVILRNEKDTLISQLVH